MSNVTPFKSPQSTPLPELLALHRTTKSQITQLQGQLADVEAQILTQVISKPEGSVTTLTPDFKVTTTGKMYRKVDEGKLTAVRKEVSRSIFNKLFPAKHSVVKKELDYLANNEPEIYASVAGAITTTPGKTAIKIEVL
ncbi:MAG: hypothetical protein GY813_19390 [Halieaceae bacterium]|nr:hypothetical protein [Halieaceae bacterium]